MMSRGYLHLCLLLVLPLGRGCAADGQSLFNDSCALCHQKGGTGSPGFAPPLANRTLFSRLGNNADLYITGVMLGGMSGVLEVDGTSYKGLIMPSQARMTDEELAAIGTYVLRELNGTTNQ